MKIDMDRLNHKKKWLVLVLALVLALVLIGAAYFYFSHLETSNSEISIQKEISQTPDSNSDLDLNLDRAIFHLLQNLLQSAPYDDVLAALEDTQDTIDDDIKTALAPYARRGVPNPAQIQTLYMKWRFALSPDTLLAETPPPLTHPAPPALLIWLHNISGGRITLAPIQTQTSRTLDTQTKRLLAALDEAAFAQDFATALRVSEHLALALMLDDNQDYKIWREHTTLYLEIKPHIEKLLAAQNYKIGAP